MSSLDKTRQKNNLDAILVSSPANIIYLTGFSGFSETERDGFVLITKNKQFILTSALYFDEVKEKVSDFEVLKVSLRDLTSLDTLAKKYKLQTLGIEEDDLRVTEFKELKQVFKTKAIDLYNLREIKTPAEIGKIKKSCEIGDLAFKYITKQLKVGITELEVAQKLEQFFRKHNATPSFRTIVAFGKNAATPHHQTDQTKLKNNQFVLLDFGVKYENYCSDMTRTVFVGKPIKKQRDLYHAVLESQASAIKYLEERLQEGEQIFASDVDAVSRNYLIQKGYPSIPHSLGHGIGIEVHEAPSLSTRSEDFLTEGQVFSIEPGVYLEGDKGVRIEDLFAIQNNKLVRLTASNNSLLEI